MACSPTSTRCTLPSEELDRDAKTFVRFKDVTVLRQSIIGHLPRHTQTRVVVGTEGGLGVRSVGMLASSAVLTSAAATLPLQDAILSKFVHGEEDPAVRSAILVWTKISQSTIPANALKHVQKAWDSPVTASVYQKLLAGPHNTPIGAARLRAVTSEHAGPGSMPRQSPQSDYVCLTKASEWRWVTV